MEIVKYSIRKKEMTASVMCIGALEGRRTPMHNIGAVMADALLKDTPRRQTKSPKLIWTCLYGL